MKMKNATPKKKNKIKKKDRKKKALNTPGVD